MPPAGGAGAKSGFLCGGEGLVGGRWLAGLLLELGQSGVGAGATQYRSLFGGMRAADLLLELGRREGGFDWRIEHFDVGSAATGTCCCK